jgi:hypothetical protein
MRRLIGGLAVTLVLVACSEAAVSESGSESLPAPDPNARIVVEPARAEPGDVVALGFPDEMIRGILFVMEGQTANGWLPAFFLTSDGPGPDWEMTWQPPGGAGLAVEDIGVGGPGPDHVVIPEVAEPGTYRICTANAAEKVCALVEVVTP